MRNAWPVLFLLLAGCTERWIQVRSEPPGATVYIDGERVGTTPCETPFVWYGKRELVLEMDDFLSHTTMISLPAPWWQWPIIDLFPDFLLPWTFTDRHEFSVSLETRTFDPKARGEVRKRAEELKKRLAEDP